MSTKILTIPEYAKAIKGASRQTVLKAIKDCEKGKDKLHLLPNVIEYKKLGRDYILTVAI